jgi:hypothetical protein
MEQILTLQQPGFSWFRLLIETIENWFVKKTCAEEENYFLIN